MQVFMELRREVFFVQLFKTELQPLSTLHVSQMPEPAALTKPTELAT